MTTNVPRNTENICTSVTTRLKIRLHVYTPMDFTLNDHSQLLLCFPHMDSGATGSIPTFPPLRYGSVHFTPAM